MVVHDEIKMMHMVTKLLIHMQPFWLN